MSQVIHKADATERSDLMDPIYVSIQQEQTGNRIKELISNEGYSVRDIQEFMGFDNPQAVYKWLKGKSMPSIDNLLILSKVLHTSIDELIVYTGDDKLGANTKRPSR